MLHYLEQEARKVAGAAIGRDHREREPPPVPRRRAGGLGPRARGPHFARERARGAEAVRDRRSRHAGRLRHGARSAHFVAIDPDGAVTIVTHRSEMGTGIRTSLPLVIADEMEADWSRVKLVQAPGDEPRYGNQDTDGSRSMRHFIQPMRECGAAMRQMLETAAAAKWGVDASLCRAKAHHVVQLDEAKKETGQEARLRRAGQAAMALPVPPRETLLFKTPDEFTLMRKGEAKIADLRDITMGKAMYGADIRFPGMKFAVMARPAVVGGKVKTFDSAAAMKVPGVEASTRSQGVQRRAAQVRTARRRRRRCQLDLRRHSGPRCARRSSGTTDLTRATIRPPTAKAMAETAGKPGKVIRNQGDVDAAFAKGEDHLHRRVPLPASGAGVDGTAGRRGAHRRRQGRGMGTDPEPLWRAQGHRRSAQDADRERHRARDAARRRLRAQVEVGLHDRGGAHLAEARWCAGAAAVDARGRHPPLVLPHDVGRTHRDGHRRCGQGDGLAASHRGAVDHLDLQGGQRLPVQHRVRHGLRQHAVRDRERSLRERQGDGAYAHRLVPLGVEHPARCSRCSRPCARRRTSSAAIPRTFCSSSSVPTASSIRRPLGFPEDFWNYGDPYEEFPIDTARLKNVIVIAAEKAGWGKPLPKGQGLGIAAHVAWQTTSRRWFTPRSARTA